MFHVLSPYRCTCFRNKETNKQKKGKKVRLDRGNVILESPRLEERVSSFLEFLVLNWTHMVCTYGS